MGRQSWSPGNKNTEKFSGENFYFHSVPLIVIHDGDGKK